MQLRPATAPVDLGSSRIRLVARPEPALFLAAYLLYDAARWLVAGRAPEAHRHAGWIIDLERSAHVAIEGSIQRALDAPITSWLLSTVYLAAQLVGRLLVDGGIVDNTPISHAVALGAERIYVLPTTDPLARGVAMPPRGAFDVALHASITLVGARLADDLVRYADEAELIVLPALNRHHIPPTDFDHASRLIGEALADARLALGAAQTVEAVAA